MFRLDAVTLRHRGPPAVTALSGVTLSIQRGERVALMGASGSGKSSLLRVLAGLQRPTCGRVMRDGEDLARRTPAERGVGMVLQDAPLYEQMTALENVAHPLRARGERAKPARAVAASMLERVGLGSRTAARGGDLSGGERRRVALARALVVRPALLLLDEPFASLEPRLRLDLREMVRDLCNELGCACLHATHDGLEALALGTRLVILDAGAVVDDGDPVRIWRAPRCAASAALVGALPMNILSLQDRAPDAPSAGSAASTEAAPPRHPRCVAIRPEHLRLEPLAEVRSPAAPRGSIPAAPPVTPHSAPAPPHAEDAWSVCGMVRSIDPLGDRWLVTIAPAPGGPPLRAVVDDATAIPPGSLVRAAASAGALITLPPTHQDS